MKYEVLEQLFGQPVEISLISRATVAGTLGPSELDASCVELERSSERDKKRYGNLVIDAEHVITIRVLKPHVDDDDDCKAECYDDCEAAF